MESGTGVRAAVIASRLFSTGTRSVELRFVIFYLGFIKIFKMGILEKVDKIFKVLKPFVSLATAVTSAAHSFLTYQIDSFTVTSEVLFLFVDIRLQRVYASIVLFVLWIASSLTALWDCFYQFRR